MTFCHCGHHADDHYRTVGRLRSRHLAPGAGSVVRLLLFSI